MRDPKTTPGFVYRCYDADDEVIYVGSTMRPSQRLSQHRSQAPWWPEVARVETESFDCALSAGYAEWQQIYYFQPRHNISCRDVPPTHGFTVKLWRSLRERSVPQGVCIVCTRELPKTPWKSRTCSDACRAVAQGIPLATLLARRGRANELARRLRIARRAWKEWADAHPADARAWEQEQEEYWSGAPTSKRVPFLRPSPRPANQS